MSVPLRAILALTLVALALPSAARAQSSSHATPPPEAPATLRPGDIVRLQVYREPDLSGEFIVDEAGVVVFPKLGPLRVTTESPESLKASLVGRYEAFLNHSSITVTLLRRVQVLGAVRNPGLYPMDATITLGDALALAGGATPQGNPKRLVLIRNGERLPLKLSPDMPVSASAMRSGDQLFVPERNWVSQNPGVVAAGITATVTIFVALLR